MKTPHLEDSLASGLAQPGGVVVKHSGLWTRRREFESLPGYLSPSRSSPLRFFWSNHQREAARSVIFVMIVIIDSLMVFMKSLEVH